MVLRFNAEIVSLVACLEFEDHSQLRSIWLILGSRDDLHLRDKTRREISIPRVVACKKGSITQFGCGVVSLVNVVDPGSRIPPLHTRNPHHSRRVSAEYRFLP